MNWTKYDEDRPETWPNHNTHVAVIRFIPDTNLAVAIWGKAVVINSLDPPYRPVVTVRGDVNSIDRYDAIAMLGMDGPFHDEIFWRWDYSPGFAGS